jgi:hypothetical protein
MATKPDDEILLIQQHKKKFYKHFKKNLIVGIVLTFFSLGLGICGYHYLESLSWLDSYVNASMILSGMGPLANPQTTAGKWFAGSYALFSGVIFLVIATLIFAPVFNRFLIRFHMDNDKQSKS